jgi:hypothetical protein
MGLASRRLSSSDPVLALEVNMQLADQVSSIAAFAQDHQPNRSRRVDRQFEMDASKRISFETTAI